MNDKIILPVIGVVSVLIPLVVALLLFLPEPDSGFLGENSILPGVNAVINSTVSILLVLGIVFIKQKKILWHRTMMLSALALSVLFLISYVTYHYGAEETKYAGQGISRIVYFFILITHIIMSVAVVPMALISILRGLQYKEQGMMEKHRKIARWTFPIWLYVAITGVIVYLMAHVFNPVTV